MMNSLRNSIILRSLLWRYWTGLRVFFLMWLRANWQQKMQREVRLAATWQETAMPAWVPELARPGGEGRGMRIMISAHGALDQALIYHMKKKDKIEQFWEGGLLPNCGIDIIDYDPETREYTFKEEMLYYYDKELFEKVPRLLK